MEDRNNHNTTLITLYSDIIKTQHVYMRIIINKPNQPPTTYQKNDITLKSKITLIKHVTFTTTHDYIIQHICKSNNLRKQNTQNACHGVI